MLRLGTEVPRVLVVESTEQVSDQGCSPLRRFLTSIIVPVYNTRAFVCQAVDACLNQAQVDIEVIVVDDGSTDGSGEVLAGFRDPRLKYFYQENQGQSSAINLGVAASQGDYIKLLDADDWIPPNHVATQLASLSDHVDAVASCRWGYFLQDFHQPEVRYEVTNRDYEDPMEWIVDSLTCDEGMMGGWMWLIPREVWIRAGGYNERLSLNNDFDFSIRLLLASASVRFADGAVYCYRKGVSGALSSSHSRRAMESAFLTTDLGTRSLLRHENSERIRRVSADRFQQWLFQFYPEFPDLVEAAEDRIREFGGSDLQMGGGRLLKLLKPIIGWKAVRRLQMIAYRCGWSAILSRKNRIRTSKFR